jgi:hypothetical protein
MYISVMPGGIHVRPRLVCLCAECFEGKEEFNRIVANQAVLYASAHHTQLMRMKSRIQNRRQLWSGIRTPRHLHMDASQQLE